MAYNILKGVIEGSVDQHADQEIDGVIVSEGGSRDSWGITIETQDDDNKDYTMDIGIRMKEVQ